MSRKCRKYQSLLGVILAVFSLTACGLSGGPESGKVIDASTNEPVEGAIVVARWIGHLATWAHGSTNCYHVESTTTDENGEFHIPRWKKEYTEDWQKNVSPRYVDVTVYKPGYQQTLGDAEGQANKLVIYNLEPFEGSQKERLEYLTFRVISGTSCRDAGESYMNLYLLRHAVYQEATAISISTEDIRISERIKAIADETLQVTPPSARRLNPDQ